MRFKIDEYGLGFRTTPSQLLLPIALAVLWVRLTISTPVGWIPSDPLTLGFFLVVLVVWISHALRSLPAPAPFALTLSSRAVGLSRALRSGREWLVTRSATVSEFLDIHGASSVDGS